MNGRQSLLALAVMVALAGCGEAPQAEETGAEPAEESAAVPAWVGQVAAVSNAIEESPAAADSILAAHGMTRARFDSLLYVIAADPMLTDAYQEARR